jgi:LacI family transcriptional regulator
MEGEERVAVTMSEIARRLNISIATVSRALSGKADTVSEQTRKAIFDAVGKYGYKKRRSVGKSVAFVIDKDSFNLSSQFYAQVISGIEEELVRNKYYFHFNSVEREHFELTRINLDFQDLAGIIMVGVYHDDFVLTLRRTETPMVLLDYYIPTEDFPAVLIDNADGVLKACKYLASLGHTRIAYLSGDRVETSAQERLYGYHRAQELFGFESDPALVVQDCKSRIDEGFRGMTELLEGKIRPTAVMAYNDLIAAGAMDAIRRQGLSVPQDISVVGFDDIGLAAEVNPALTTVHVPKHTMGTLAVQKLLEIVKGGEESVQKTLVPTSLVVRSSTGAPPGQGRAVAGEDQAPRGSLGGPSSPAR